MVFPLTIRILLPRICQKKKEHICMSQVMRDCQIVSSQPSLESITLCCAKFIRDDLQHLSHITEIHEFPMLETLDLCFSRLAGCLSNFLPDPHTGLSGLTAINLICTTLDENDLQHLVISAIIDY